MLFSHPCVYTLCSKLFNLFIEWGFVPDDFGRSYTVPLPKTNTVGKSMSVDDFRGISISPLLSKVFETCILDRYGDFLKTADNQFGFKRGLGCSHAIYSVRCVVNHYVRSCSTVNLCALDLKKAFDKTNHYGLYIKLMEKGLPNNILSVLEYWYDFCVTCIRWGNAYSVFIKLECGVRQGGVLSPYLFAVFIDGIVRTMERSGLGCHVNFVPVCIFLYADDIILLSPSVSALQQMIFICERELIWLDMALNPMKSVCLRFGPRYDKPCEPLTVASGQKLCWVTSCRYLGVYLLSSANFKCSLDNGKKAYYRAFNAIFGKVGRHASEEVVLKLIQMKCIPVILHGLDCCPLNASEKHSLDFVLTRSLMKLFQTGSNIVITECRSAFRIKLLSELVRERKLKFLSKFSASENGICQVFATVAAEELNNI